MDIDREQLTELFNDIAVSMSKLTAIIERISLRLDELQGRTQGEPRQPGPPNYMSGRWYRRDGNGFGQPPP